MPEIDSNHLFRLRGKSFFLWLGAITLLALLLRLGVCAELRGIRSVADPMRGTDMETYKRVALEILRGHSPSHYYYQPFYYSVFLPCVYALSGVGVWGPLLVQALLGAAAVWLTGLAGAQVFGRRAGLLAAALLALSRFHIFYTPFLLLEVLQSFWLILLAHLTLRAWAEGGWWRWALTGLIAGAAILTRGNVLLLLPGVLGLLIWQCRRHPCRLVTRLALFAALAYLPQLPFSLRNREHYGRWTGPSSAEDAVLALGNTPEAPPGGLEYTPTYHEWVHEAGQAPPARVPVSRQMLRWLRREPLAVFELKFRTFLLFWHRMEIPNNVAMANEGRHSLILRMPLLLEFVVIGTLAVVGMFLLWKPRCLKRVLLYFLVLAYCLATVLFYMLARFRVPLLPLLCVFAGAALAHIPRWCGRPSADIEKRRRILAAALASTVAFFFVFQGYTFYRMFMEPAVMRGLRPDGLTVATREFVRVYDHGPMMPTGWQWLTIPPQGIALEKTFMLSNTVDLAPVEPAVYLRLPLQGDPDTRVRMVMAIDDRDPIEDVLTLAGTRGVQWKLVRVEKMGLEDRPVHVRLSLQTLHGKAYLALDPGRDYGRTTLFDPHGQRFSAGAEACLELQWDRIISGM